MKPCRWDSQIFLGCFMALAEKLPEAETVWKAEVAAAVGQVWENYYFIGESKDLAFALGVVAVRAGAYAEAIQFLQISVQLYGPDPSTFYYLGQAFYHLGELEPALVFAQKAVAADPDSAVAQQLLATLTSAQTAPNPDL